MAYHFELPHGITEEEIRKYYNQPTMQVIRGLQLRFLKNVRKKTNTEILNNPIAKTAKGERMSKQQLDQILNAPVFTNLEALLDEPELFRKLLDKMNS